MVFVISGAITGVPNYRQNFKQMEYTLRLDGHVVLNPCMLPEDGLTYDQYMHVTLAMVDIADAIVMLRGWHKSNGAIIERQKAIDLNIPRYYEQVDGGIKSYGVLK